MWNEAIEGDVKLSIKEWHVEGHDATGKQSRRLQTSEGDPENSTGVQCLIAHLRAKYHDGRCPECPSDLESSGWAAKLTEELDRSISKSRFYLATMNRSSDSGSTEYLLGYGPKDMEPGDEVVVLHGSREPVVLRPEETWWLWAGPAFCQALSDMTLVFVAASPESSVEVFEIQ